MFSAGISSAGMFSIGIFSAGMFSIGIFSIGIFCTGIIPDVEVLGGCRERRRTGERGTNEMGDKEGDDESEELIVEMRFLN